jgi:hypothetical protein
MKSATFENGICTDPQKKIKNSYEPWMRHAFMLGFCTGGRLDNVTFPRWSDIVYKADGAFDYIDCENYKVNKIEGREDEDTKKRIFYSITNLLADTLELMGHEEHRGTNNYILAPTEPRSRSYMQQLISRAFSHYYSRLYPTKKKTFKHLRKGYLSNLYILFGDDTYKESGHASNDVVVNHYVTDEALAERERVEENQMWDDAKKNT